MNKTKSIKLAFSIILGAMAIILLILNSISSVSAYNAAPKKLIVKGSSELNFKPDTASVCVGVETVNSNLTTAQKENASTMEKVIETLTNNGINKSEIKTTGYNIYKQHNFNNGSEFSNTQVSNRICFKTTNIDGLSDLITKLTESGANVFGGITFELSDSSEAYNKALEQAIENAKTKAQVLAPNANLEIAEILEEYSYCSPCYFDNFARAELTSNYVMQGDVTVCANVKVVFKSEITETYATENKLQNNMTSENVLTSTKTNNTDLNNANKNVDDNVNLNKTITNSEINKTEISNTSTNTTIKRTDLNNNAA